MSTSNANAHDGLAAQIQQLARERDEATNQLAVLVTRQGIDSELLKLRSEVTQLRLESEELAKLKARVAAKETNPSTGETDSVIDRVRRLKERLEQTPAAKIPELQFLTEDDWITAAGDTKQLITDEDFRAAFSDLRNRGEARFLDTTEKALRKYMEANKNQFPTELSQLRSYFEKIPGDELLQHYQIVPASSIPVASATSDPGDWLITLKSPVDGGLALGTNGVVNFVNDSAMDILAPAMRAMADDTPSVNGKKTMRMDQLGPYLKTPEQKAAYESLIHNSASR